MGCVPSPSPSSISGTAGIPGPSATARPTPTPVPTVADQSLGPVPPAFLPRGSLRGQLVDASGEAFAPGDNWNIFATGDIDRYEPDGATGMSTNPDGSFLIDGMAEMGWAIEVMDRTGAIVGSAHVDINGGETSYVEIEVQK